MDYSSVATVFSLVLSLALGIFIKAVYKHERETREKDKARRIATLQEAHSKYLKALETAELAGPSGYVDVVVELRRWEAQLESGASPDLLVALHSMQGTWPGAFDWHEKLGKLRVAMRDEIDRARSDS